MLHTYKIWLTRGAAVAGLAFTLMGSHAYAYDRRIQVINNSTVPIYSLYEAHVGSSAWIDALGSYQILPGKSAIVNLDDGSGYCRFDLVMVMRDGETSTHRGVDVCTLERWTVR